MVLGSERRRVAAALVLTAAALLVLLWASSAEPERFTAELPGAGSAEEAPQDPGEDSASVAPPEQEPLPVHPPAEPGEFSPWIWTGLQLLGAAVLLAVLAVLLLLLRRALRWWSGRRADRSVVEPPEDPLGLAAEATGEQVRRRAAAETVPRNAVVACWAALEHAAERAGMDRRGSETSEEFTARVLDRWEVEAQLVAELAALYRAARFSRMELTEEDRQKALTALRRVNAAISAAQEARRREQEAAA